MEDNCWIYKGVCLTAPPSGFCGFIYKITDDKGYVYFGKKVFEYSQKVKIVERIKKDSGWMDYWGSCKPLIMYLDEDSRRKNNSKREIIKFCKDKASLSYWEMVTMVQESVLFRDDCWNSNILGKFFKGKIHI